MEWLILKCLHAFICGIENTSYILHLNKFAAPCMMKLVSTPVSDILNAWLIWDVSDTFL